MLERLASLRAEQLDAQSEENLGDLEEFLARRLASPNLAAALTHERMSEAEATRLLLEKSEGNFLYVRQALDAVERKERVCTLANLADNPIGEWLS